MFQDFPIIYNSFAHKNNLTYIGSQAQSNFQAQGCCQRVSYNNQSSIMKEQDKSYEQAQNSQQTKNGNVSMLVIVRVRPLTPRQLATDNKQIVKVLDNQTIILLDANQESDKRQKNRQIQFTFDFTYNNASNTKQIYDESLSNLLDGVLQGYNSTILAYGATGCGKTYTMIGEGGKEGILALAMIDLLGRAHEMKRHKNIIIRISYIQIYNQSIKDLLISQDKNLDLREDPKEGMMIPGVTEITINSMLELATVLKVGAANRSKQTTISNEASSRSHSLLLVKTETKDKGQDAKLQINVGKLTLVDLAGSERAGGQKGARQIQGSKINKSLLALGNCIQVLAQPNSKTSFVPYRESKLTRLLKESLGGNCRTAMIVNISPFSANWEDSHNSLLYASRAKNIKNFATKNSQASEAPMGNYIALIGNLKRENDDLKKQLKGAKNLSLPQLKSASVMDGGEKLQFQRTQNKIDIHFNQEIKLLQIISQLTVKLDKVAFKLYRIQLQSKKDQKNAKKGQTKSEKSQKNQAKMNKIIQDLSGQKSEFQTKLQDLVFDRGTIMSEIKLSEFSQSSISLLISHYREKKIETELQQIRLREHRIECEKQQKQKLMSLMGEQLKIRDSIIQEQRLIIQKNNIINRITYSKLGFANNNLFSNIFQTLNQAQKPLLPIDTQYNEKNNKEKHSMENSVQKQSLSKKKKINKLLGKEDSFDRLRINEQESQLLGISPKHSIKEKVKRNISPHKNKKKNAQLDFVYMQR